MTLAERRALAAAPSEADKHAAAAVETTSSQDTQAETARSANAAATWQPRNHDEPAALPACSFPAPAGYGPFQPDSSDVAPPARESGPPADRARPPRGTASGNRASLLVDHRCELIMIAAVMRPSRHFSRA